MRNRLSITLPSVLRRARDMGRWSLALLLFAGVAPAASAQVVGDHGGACDWSGQGPALGIGIEAGGGPSFVVIGIFNPPIEGVLGPCTYSFQATNVVQVDGVVDAGGNAGPCCTFNGTNAAIGVKLKACANPTTESQDGELVMKTTDRLGHTSTTIFPIMQNGIVGPPNTVDFSAVRASINRRLGKAGKFLMRSKDAGVCIAVRG